ncbi:alpha/beta fold hydrolase [Chachezhania antarctica]|uniref:alpha/beta fold hydrolase n=1 Tax=Chachezhania antarctica TaxID=2340860 RepID=UPI000EACF38E|nr:alpha/beta hydrolase [Chachezhania antarctica]
MRTETIQLGGNPFFLRRWGDPDLPPLLMLHGYPEYSGAWEDLAPLLSDRFHCIAPDQRGYGNSWAPEGVENYAVSALVGDMSALIDHLGGRVTLLGHDWGAAIAYGLAFSCPEKIDRLIILNGVHPVPYQRALARGGAQTDASQYISFLRRDDSHEILGKNGFEKLHSLFSAKMDTSWLAGDRKAAYEDAWKDRLQTMINWYRASPIRVPKPGETIDDLPDYPVDRLKVRCPHLLIWGLNDTALLPESTEGLEVFAPNLTRIEVPDADHWICHQQPDRVAKEILTWIDG